MRPSDLKERVLFQEPLGGDDGFGGEVQGWSAGFETRAFYTYLRTGESVMASRLAGRQVLAVKIRANETSLAINTGHRMIDQNTLKTFNVKGVEPSQDRRWLEVLVEGGDLR